MGYLTPEIREILSMGDTLPLDSYPIFDEGHREELNKKIITHFYVREIAFETVTLFKLKLEAKMNEIMPYYNKMYLSADLEYDPLTNTHYTETSKSKYKGVSKNEGVDKNLYNDTPMGLIDDVYSDNYASNTTKNTNNSLGEVTNDGGSRREIHGKTDAKSYAELVKDYRSAIVNIDMLIITELNTLFLCVWG